MDLTFQNPLLLLLLPVAVIPAILPHLWKRRMGPVTMRYTDIGLVTSTRRSPRLRLTPFVPALRLLALGTCYRCRRGAATSGCTGGHPRRGRGYRHSPRRIGEHG